MALDIGSHGEVGAIANEKANQGLPDKENGKATHLTLGSHGGSVNLPNTKKEEYDPNKVVPQSSCKGAENCNGLMEDSGVRDIWSHHTMNTIRSDRDKQPANQWDPNGYHSWDQTPGGAQWPQQQEQQQRQSQKREISPSPIASRRRMILKRYLDDFAVYHQRQPEDGILIGMILAS